MLTHTPKMVECFADMICKIDSSMWPKRYTKKLETCDNPRDCSHYRRCRRYL